MILLNRLSRGYHFARPLLSSVGSLRELEVIMQQRLVNAIKQTNAFTLKRHSLPQLVQELLMVEATPAKHISERSVNLSIVNPRTLEHREVELRLDQDLRSLKLEAVEFGANLPSSESAVRHFSKERGVATFEELQEYVLDDRSLLMFNLPENISEQDIQVLLKEKPARIEFKYCVLGLPAYARVEFEDTETLGRCLQKTRGRI
jgi:hypothetical protein